MNFKTIKKLFETKMRQQVYSIKRYTRGALKRLYHAPASIANYTRGAIKKSQKDKPFQITKNSSAAE